MGLRFTNRGEAGKHRHLPVEQHTHDEAITFGLERLCHDVKAVQSVAYDSRKPHPAQVSLAKLVADARVPVQRLSELGVYGRPSNAIQAFKLGVCSTEVQLKVKKF